MKHTLTVLQDHYTICKLDAKAAIPTWAIKSGFYSITRTDDELSIVCRQSFIPDSIKNANKEWRILKMGGLLDFTIVGIIADISGILKEKNISIFTISTYNTDYILVKNENLEKSVNTLTLNGYKVASE